MSEYDDVYRELSKVSNDITSILNLRRTLQTSKNTMELIRKAERLAKLAKRFNNLTKQGKVWTSSDKQGLRGRVIDIKYGYIKDKVPSEYKTYFEKL